MLCALCIADFPSSIVYMNIYGNRFMGTLPDMPASLRYFDATNNNLLGTLPPLQTYSPLRSISLRNNAMFGQLPASWVSAFSRLRTLDLSNNQLSGDLNFQAASAELGGAAPWDLGSLGYLDLSGNYFTGEGGAPHHHVQS